MKAKEPEENEQVLKVIIKIFFFNMAWRELYFVAAKYCFKKITTWITAGAVGFSIGSEAADDSEKNQITVYNVTIIEKSPVEKSGHDWSLFGIIIAIFGLLVLFGLKLLKDKAKSEDIETGNATYSTEDRRNVRVNLTT